MRALVAIALAYGCAATNANIGRPIPMVAAHAVDMVAFSAGCIAGLSQYNKPGHDGNDALMYGGFGLALASWLPYWVVETR